MKRLSIFYCHLFMRHILIAILLFCAVISYGQNKERLSFSVQLQPELTYHKNNYAYRWKDTYTKSTFNIGIEAYPLHQPLVFLQNLALHLCRYG